RRNVLVGHRDLQVFRFLLELGLLHEVLHRLILKRLVLGCPRLRERCLARLVRALRAGNQEIELILRDRRVSDARDRTRWNGPRAAAAACGNEDEDEQQGDRRKAKRFHVHPVRSVAQTAEAGGSFHAAWRESKIASTSRSAWGKPSSLRRLTSWLPMA